MHTAKSDTEQFCGNTRILPKGACCNLKTNNLFFVQIHFHGKVTEYNKTFSRRLNNWWYPPEGSWDSSLFSTLQYQYLAPLISTPSPLNYSNNMELNRRHVADIKHYLTSVSLLHNIYWGRSTFLNETNNAVKLGACRENYSWSLERCCLWSTHFHWHKPMLHKSPFRAAEHS